MGRRARGILTARPIRLAAPMVLTSTPHQHASPARLTSTPHLRLKYTFYFFWKSQRRLVYRRKLFRIPKSLRIWTKCARTSTIFLYFFNRFSLKMHIFNTEKMKKTHYWIPILVIREDILVDNSFYPTLTYKEEISSRDFNASCSFYYFLERSIVVLHILKFLLLRLWRVI